MTDLIHPETGDQPGCSLRELCERIALDEQFVIQCVEHGIARVEGQQTVEWTFSTEAVLRIRKAWRLHRDLDLHISSLGLVLELLDDRDTLQQEVLSLRRRLREWEQA
jgi:chaperone modulatory protein CbpM